MGHPGSPPGTPSSPPDGLSSLAMGAAAAAAALALVIGTGWAINVASAGRPGVTTARVTPFVVWPTACPTVRATHLRRSKV